MNASTARSHKPAASVGAPKRSFWRRALRGRRGRFGRDERGIVAVEMAMITPFLLVFFVGIVDFGSFFFLQNNMTYAAREAARQLALGSLSETEAEDLARARLVNWNGTFTVDAALPTGGSSDVTVTISVPMIEAAPIGLVFDLIHFNGTLQAQVIMRQET